MIARNDQVQYQESPTKLIEPASMCVNMTYDPSGISWDERAAACSFIDLVGGLDRAREVLRQMQPVDPSV